MARAHHLLGVVAKVQGEKARAKVLFKEALVLRRDDAHHELPESLEALASLVLEQVKDRQESQHRTAQAVQLWAAAAVARRLLGVPLRPIDRVVNNEDIAVAHTMIDSTTWESHWAIGEAMTLEQAIAYALDETNPE